ncbi:MAG: DUF1292 domain-containing protein [Ruminococcus sp.]|nr:DUF1292 domain-containing protein [Ruminococcus sp.]
MSEIIDNNIPEEEEYEQYITITGDNGEELSFEVLGITEHKERSFIVLLPFDEEDDGIVILELVPSDDPDMDEFIPVEDEELLGEVFEEFKKNYDGEYEFE